ncbi:MAG: HIT family protein [Pseudomonadota bacterium]
MSLDTAYDDANIFAKILRGEIPSAKVFEDDDVLSFMDAFPQSRGHTLVIPKHPAVNLFDLPPDALQTLIARVQTIAIAVRKTLTPDGVFIGQFNGSPAGQTVFHIHFHIIPRYEAQPYQAHAQGEQADMDQLKALAAEISAAL